MIEHPYLIAFALIEQKTTRAMPLGGKSLKHVIPSEFQPGQAGEGLAMELLMRVFQRSEDAPLRRAAGENSLFLVLIPMEYLQDKIPLIKSEWLKSGDNKKFFSQLYDLCEGVWALNFSKGHGIQFSRLDKD